MFGMAKRVTAPAMSHTVAAALLAAITLAFGVRTSIRNSDWRDDVTLWGSAVRAAPNSFKAHQGLADALYESDPGHRDITRVIDEANRSIAILDTLPDTANVPASYRRAAGYYLEHGDALRDSETRSAVSDSKTAYEKSVALTERYLAIVRAQRGDVTATRATTTPAGRPSLAVADGPAAKDDRWELSEAYVMLSTGYARLQNRPRAMDAGKEAQRLQPLNSIPYRVIAATLIDDMRFDEAAVWLLAGFMVSGDRELTQATLDLYRAGGDPKGCAVKQGDEGPVLNPACETVRNHYCAALAKAVDIQRANGRSELAQQFQETGRADYGCAAQ
jgi:hypothetical protein